MKSFAQNRTTLPCSNTSQPQAKPVDGLAQGVKPPDATGRFRASNWLSFPYSHAQAIGGTSIESMKVLSCETCKLTRSMQPESIGPERSRVQET
jgi:hypothetical protein